MVISSGGCVFGTSRGRDGAGDGSCGVCVGGAIEVGLVMILVGTLVATGVRLNPVATL